MINLEKQIFRQIEKAKEILIIFPRQKDGDSLAASLAFFIFLKSLNKSVDLVENNSPSLSEDFKENSLSFLPNFDDIKKELSNLRSFIVSLNIKNTTLGQIKYSVDENELNFIVSPSSGWLSPEDLSLKTGEFKYDLIITIGVNDLELLGGLYDNNVEFFYKTTIINIDRSPANEDFGQINFIDLNSITNSEIAYYLLKNYESGKINEDVATCLLAGIIRKTKNFKIENLSPRTLLASSELISLGARREDIIKNLFYSRTINSLKLWAEILKTLKSENNGKFLWSKISQGELDSHNLKNDALEEIIDELIGGLPEAKVFVLLIEADTMTEIKVFSLKSINALELLKDYRPNGNPIFAQAISSKKEKGEKEIINDLKTIFENSL